MSQDRNGEALRNRVTELQAAVDGLTEELVDAKERIRELEIEAGLRTIEEAEAIEEDITVEELFEKGATDGDEGPTSNDEDPEVIGDDIIVG